jgi:hypothetical protein
MRLTVPQKASASAALSVPQYATDPVSPSPGDMWILATGDGTPMGLLLAITHGTHTKYQLSYRTGESTTIRVELS